MMAVNNQSLSVLTFNMHGFNQGVDFLSEALSSELYDIIFIQEHWLNDDDLYKLSNLSTKYVLFGESAMGKSITTGVLQGRPYGGVATIVKKSISC